MKFLMILTLGLSLVACDKTNSDGTYTRAKAESEAQKDTQNKNVDERAQKMERDLQKRFRFYNGVSNNYHGFFKINKNTYQMKVELFPSIHIIESNRIRTIEEIQDDMNNLFLNAQVVIWDQSGSIGAKGCVFDKVKPDIMNGVIQLISNECPNRYIVYVGTSKSSQSEAQALLEGRQISAPKLQVSVSSQYNAQGYSVLLNKR